MDATARQPSGGRNDELKAELKEHTERVRLAEERRRHVLGLMRGSKLRVGLLELETDGNGLAALLANLGISTAAFMLMEVINGNLPVKDARQAADIAKIALDIHRQMTGDEEGDLATLPPEKRAERRTVLVREAKSMIESWRERAEKATDVTLDEVAAVPPSPSAAPRLGIVSATPPVQAEEG